ncbi:hypothetical protein HK405_007803, partial [Cladochytrium tenue]
PTPSEPQQQVQETLHQQVRFEQQILPTPTPQQLQQSYPPFFIPYHFFWVEEALSVESSLSPSAKPDSGLFQSALRLLLSKVLKIVPESTSDLSTTSISFRCIQLPQDPSTNLPAVAVLAQQPDRSPIAECVARLRGDLLVAHSNKPTTTQARMPGSVADTHDDGWRERFEERFDRTIAELRENNVELQKEVVQLHKKDAESQKEIIELQKEIVELQKEIVELRMGNVNLNKTVSSLLSSSDKIQRRSLLDMARAKLFTVLDNVDLARLSNEQLLQVQRESGVPITQAAISRVGTGRVRSDGNAAAHPDDVKAIREAIKRIKIDNTLREDLVLLFRYVFGSNPDEDSP